MSVRSAFYSVCGVALVVSGTGRVALAHEIFGVQSYYSCQPALARAFLRSPNPGNMNRDYPLEVLDANGNPTGEHVVAITVQNQSLHDARVTAAGFAWPESHGFELVQLHSAYNDLATVGMNMGLIIRRGTISPSDYTVVPSIAINQSHGQVNFTIRPDIQGVPGFPHTGLNVALVTGNTFSGGKPADGLAPDAVRHVIAIKGVVPADDGGSIPHMETLLNDAYVRFRKVGPQGDGSETGIWTMLLPQVSCP